LKKVWTSGKTYNGKLLFYSGKYSFPIISFDSHAELYKEKIALVLDLLGLKSGSEAAGFFEERFRRHTMPPDAKCYMYPLL